MSRASGRGRREISAETRGHGDKATRGGAKGGDVMEILQFLGRGLVAGFVVVSAAEISRRWPRVGALVLTLPTVIPAVFVVMYLRSGEVAPIARMSRETLMLIPLGLPFFVPLAFAEKWGLGFWGAFGMGSLLVVATVGVYLRVT
jgi:hypothetical protein